MATDPNLAPRPSSPAPRSGLEEVGRMLNSMMEKADSFCGPLDSALHETTAEYFTPADAPATDY